MTEHHETRDTRGGGVLGIIKREIRLRPQAYAVLAVFLILGPVIARMIFPEAPTGAGLFGGFALAIYAALSAVPEKFL